MLAWASLLSLDSSRSITVRGRVGGGDSPPSQDPNTLAFSGDALPPPEGQAGRGRLWRVGA